MEIFLPCFYFLFFCFPRSHNRFQILFQFLVNYRVLFLHLVLILYLVLANYNNRAPQHYTPTTSQNCGYKTPSMCIHVDAHGWIHAVGHLQFHMCCVQRCCSAYLGCTNFPFKHISRMLLQCSVFNFLSSSCSIQTKGSVWFCSLFAKEKHKVQLQQICVYF